MAKKTFDQLLATKRYSLVGWAKPIFYAAYDAAPSSHYLRENHRDLLIICANEVEAVAERFQQELLQRTGGLSYTESEWMEELHGFHKRFTIEILTTALAIAQGKK